MVRHNLYHTSMAQPRLTWSFLCKSSKKHSFFDAPTSIMCAVHSFNDSAKMNIGINKAELDSALAMVREFEDRVGVSTMQRVQLEGERPRPTTLQLQVQVEALRARACIRGPCAILTKLAYPFAQASPLLFLSFYHLSCPQLLLLRPFLFHDVCTRPR